MKLTKKKIKEIKRLAKAYETAHILGVKLYEEFKTKGLNPEYLSDEFNSLRMGDITAEDFIEDIENDLEG